MIDDPYQPPAAPIRPEPPAPSAADDRAATRSLRFGAASALLAWLPLAVVREPRPRRHPEFFVLLAGTPLPAVVLVAVALIFGIIGWNSAHWRRALFGIVLAILGMSITTATVLTVALG